MGNKRKRLERLKIEHPFCYFCATGSTESEDHVPSRECFHDRIGPEGFGFPACARCNNSAGPLEQVVALYMLLANHEERDPSDKQITRLLLGVKNNNPELMPIIETSARSARAHFKQQGISPLPGQTFADTPILLLPEGNRSAMELFARRLTCALYYKEAGLPLPLDHYITTTWIAWSHPDVADIATRFREFLPEFTLTNRRNTDIGDQFTYLWGLHPEKSVFAYAAQFKQSFLFFGAVAAPELTGDQIDGKWKLHSLDVPA